MTASNEEELRKQIADVLDVFGHQVINKEFGGNRVVLKREPMRRIMQLIQAYGIECRIDELSSPTMSYSKEVRRMKHHLDIGNLTPKGLGSYEELASYESARLRRIAELTKLKDTNGEQS